MSCLKMSFAENFRAARKELKLTQMEGAKPIGVKRSAVAHYENGISLPHAGTLQKICEILQIPIGKIFKYKKLQAIIIYGLQSFVLFKH